MKQPFASVAKLRGGGPILCTAWRIWPWMPAGCHHLGSLSAARCAIGVGAETCMFALRLDDHSGRLPQHDALRDFTCVDHAPQRDEQLAGESDDHRRLERALGSLGPLSEPLG